MLNTEQWWEKFCIHILHCGQWIVVSSSEIRLHILQKYCWELRLYSILVPLSSFYSYLFNLTSFCIYLGLRLYSAQINTIEHRYYIMINNFPIFILKNSIFCYIIGNMIISINAFYKDKCNAKTIRNRNSLQYIILYIIYIPISIFIFI